MDIEIEEIFLIDCFLGTVIVLLNHADPLSSKELLLFLPNPGRE